MPRGQKLSPHHRHRRKTHFLVPTSTMPARTSMTRRVLEKLCTEKVCVAFLAPKSLHTFKRVTTTPGWGTCDTAPSGIGMLLQKYALLSGGKQCLGRPFVLPSISQCFCRSLDGRNRAIVIAESLARFIAAIRIASVRWRSLENTEISRHRPCARCAAIRIARLAFTRLTFVLHGTAEWLARVDRAR